MNDSRFFEKLAPLSGVVAAVLMIVGSVVIGFYEYLPPADRVADFLSRNATRVAVGGYVGGISALFLVWFAGSVYSALREHEGTGRLATVAFGGGVFASVIMATAFAGMIAAAGRAGTEGGITAGEAVALYDVWSSVMGVTMPIGLAVLIGATAAVSLRTSAFPAWFGWVSAIIALGLISPVGYVVMAGGLVWVLVVSIWLYARGASEIVASARRDPVAGAA